MRLWVAVAVVAAVVIAGALPATAGTAKTKLISKTSAGAPASGGGSSESAAISGSGRFVAFRSLATNLPGNPAIPDVYAHDRKTGRTTLISKTSSGEPAADGFSSNPAISASGRYIAFESIASNLPGANGLTQVYVHDRKTRRTRLLSKTSAGEPANGASFNISLSATGRFVAFNSGATNLPGSPAFSDVYVHDRKTRKTKLVSKTSTGETLDEVAGAPSISASGRFVAFDSDATNLPGNDGAGITDVFVRDRKRDTTRLVSKSSSGATGDDSSFRPSISARGRFVAFASSADNFPGSPSTQDIHVHDRKTGKTRLVSKTSGGAPANESSSGPSISASGRFVAFASTATNLPGDTAFTNVYVHDRRRGKTRLMSQTSAGAPATGGPSDEASISARGLFVAFDSAADNLPGDDEFANVYVRGPLR